MRLSTTALFPQPETAIGLDWMPCWTSAVLLTKMDTGSRGPIFAKVKWSLVYSCCMLGLVLPSGSRISAGLLRKYKGNSSYENLVLRSAEISLSSSLLLDKGTLLSSKYFSIMIWHFPYRNRWRLNFVRCINLKKYLFHDNRKWKSIGKCILCGYYCVGPEDAGLTPKGAAQ
jgi:hypothetical protein